MISSVQYPKCKAELVYGNLTIESPEMDCATVLGMLQEMQSVQKCAELKGKVTIFFKPEDKRVYPFDSLAALSIKILRETAHDGC